MKSVRLGIIALVIVVILAVGATAVLAQGPGNGRGRGGNDGCTPMMNCDGSGNANSGSQTMGNRRTTMMQGYQGMQGNGMTMGNQFGPGFFNGLPAKVEGELSDDVIAAMTNGWLDEYNANAVYGTVIDQFGVVNPFANIQRAEQQHMAAWEFLFTRYGVELPTPSELEVPEFASLSEACTLAATAEINNMGLYDEMLVTLQDYPDMVQIVTSLRDASEFNHLPAFENCAN